MKKQGRVSPPGAYVIEPQAERTNGVRVRFYENARQVVVEPYWEYDEYQLVVPYNDSLEVEIESHFEEWIARAKAEERDS